MSAFLFWFAVWFVVAVVFAVVASWIDPDDPIGNIRAAIVWPISLPILLLAFSYECIAHLRRFP